MTKLAKNKMDKIEREQIIRHQIVLDIETTGLNPWYEDRVTCICAKDIDSGARFSHCLDNEKNLLIKFFNWISDFDVNDTMLITANGTTFDIPFLSCRLLLICLKSPGRFLNFAHFDVDNDITDKRISLNNIARLYSLELKTADGLQAIKWFKERELEKIRAYCWSDVLLTEKVYLMYRHLKKY